ncbi:hypothetical protein A0H81_04497 [Grifola frondosa]|uniref:Uncharacterized protein n=1 Tax=Grifola frondosa TaxID=5627 RepID=A0A1C7MF98_GRIFR|nr:hypothetical protein A0H81_04497 [Grifola frondosa]
MKIGMEAIERDSMDPQLMANLNRLGPVKVDHHMQTVRPAAGSTHHMLQARLQSEVEARSSRPTHNHLLASSLFDLLEERKTVTSQRELEELAKNYDMDISKLVGLARCVNSPSVAEGSVVRTVDRNGVESITMTAAWVDPVLRGHKSLLGSGR